MKSDRGGDGGDDSGGTADDGTDALLQLLAATQALIEAERSGEICRATVDAAGSVLGVPIGGVYLVDDGGETLELAAIADGAVDVPGYELLESASSDDLVWEAFESGETVVVSDADGAHGATPNPDTPVRSVLAVPIGEDGVFLALSLEAAAFGEREAEAAELLAATTSTALARLERTEQLRQENERLEQLAGVVSHDLTSPLSVARGWTEIARDADDPTEALDRVDTALDRVSTLLDDLVSLGRTGVTDADRSETDLGAVAGAAWERTVDGAATLDVDPDTPTVRAVPSLVGQLFENLFGNSVEHGSTAPTVSVGPLDDGGFYVADDGPGIPEGDRERVFEHGYTTGDGTGFGLTIVHAVAEAHGWAVSVTESESGGARFEIRF